MGHCCMPNITHFWMLRYAILLSDDVRVLRECEGESGLSVWSFYPRLLILSFRVLSFRMTISGQQHPEFWIFLLDLLDCNVSNEICCGDV